MAHRRRKRADSSTDRNKSTIIKVAKDKGLATVAKQKNHQHLIRSQPISEPSSTAKNQQDRPPSPTSTTSAKLQGSKVDCDVSLDQTIEQLVSDISLAGLRAGAGAEMITRNRVGQSKDGGSVESGGTSRQPMGRLRKLGELVPNPTIQKARRSAMTVSGHRQAGLPSSRLAPTSQVPPLVIAVSRKTNFSLYLKRALDHLRRFKTGHVRLMAMGCAVSLCFSLALAIESHLQIGQACRLVRSVTTGTVVLGDEITPPAVMDNNQERDMIYQTRNQASIEIELRLEFPGPFESLNASLFSLADQKS